MKKITFTILLLGLINIIHAQQEGKFRTGLDVGLGIGSGTSAGFIIGIEPKYNLKDNLNVGLRFEAAGIVKDMHEVNRANNMYDSKIQANISFMGTADYYFHKQGGNSFAPFVGGGLGSQNVANVFYTAEQMDDNVTAYNTKTQTVFGGIIRSGFEWGKFRLTAQYNIIPKTDLQDVYGSVIGKTKNNYFGLSVGLYLGGGKWRK